MNGNQSGYALTEALAAMVILLVLTLTALRGFKLSSAQNVQTLHRKYALEDAVREAEKYGRPSLSKHRTLTFVYEGRVIGKIPVLEDEYGTDEVKVHVFSQTTLD